MNTPESPTSLRDGRPLRRFLACAALKIDNRDEKFKNTKGPRSLELVLDPKQDCNVASLGDIEIRHDAAREGAVGGPHGSCSDAYQVG